MWTKSADVNKASPSVTYSTKILIFIDNHVDHLLDHQNDEDDDDDDDDDDGWVSAGGQSVW